MPLGCNVKSVRPTIGVSTKYLLLKNVHNNACYSHDGGKECSPIWCFVGHVNDPKQESVYHPNP